MKKLINSRGASLVEFAIVSLVFFMFIFGTIDFGYFFYHQHVLKDAAREGARIAVLGGVSDDEIKSKVTDKLAVLKLTGETTIDRNPPVDGQPATVTVTVSIPFSLIVLPNFLGVNIDSVSSSITMVPEP